MFFRSIALSGMSCWLLACGMAAAPDDAATSQAELTVAAGAEALPDIRFADVAPRRVFYVSTLGNDANSGSQTAPWRTLNKAVRSMVAGDATYVQQGTYYERISIAEASRDGTATAPIQLLAAPGATPIIQGGDGKSGPMVRFYRRAYWVLSGFKIDARGSLAHAVRIEGSHHVVVKSSDIGFGTGPSAIPIFGGSTDIALLANKIHDYTFGSNDSHGILILPDSARILVRGNEGFGNGGDSLQCVGPDVEGGTAVATNITIENNRFHQDRENAVDLKTCDRVTVRGNKFFGYRSTPTAVQGDALVIHMSASRILVEKNRMWNNGRSVGVGGVRVWSTPVSDVVIRRNVFFDNVIATTEAGDGIHVGSARRVKIQNNSFVNIPRAAIRMGFGSEGPTEYVEVTNNILSEAPRVFDLSRPNVKYLTSDRNVTYSTTASAFRVDGSMVSLTQWRALTSQDRASAFTNPLFIAEARYYDFYLQAGSPARDRALATGETYCATGLDIGFLENCP